MRSRALVYVTWLCMLMQLSGTAFAVGREICVGADGHLAVEVAHVGECETESRRHHDDTRTHADAGCAQHPCTDVALSEPSRASVGGPESTIAPRLTAMITTLPEPGIGWRSLAAVHGDAGLATRGALRARRTVVLLV